MVENKRVNEGVKAAQKSVYIAMQSIPEFANNPDRAEEIAVKYLKELWLPLARAGVRAKGESYQHYLDRKGSVKNTGKEIAKTLGEQFGLSKKSTEIMYGAVAGAAKLAKDKEIEIPSTRLVDRNGFTVDAGGYANITDDIYRANLAGQIENPLGIEGLTVRGKAQGSFDRPFQNVNVGGSYQVGDASTLSFGVDPINESARLGFKTTFKKGGKVKKKRKNKKYAKGCVVRAAKY